MLVLLVKELDVCSTFSFLRQAIDSALSEKLAEALVFPNQVVLSLLPETGDLDELLYPEYSVGRQLPFLIHFFSFLSRCQYPTCFCVKQVGYCS